MTTLQVLQDALDKIAASGATDQLTITADGSDTVSIGTADQRETFSSITLAKLEIENLVGEILGQPAKLQLIADFTDADYVDFMRCK